MLKWTLLIAALFFTVETAHADYLQLFPLPNGEIIRSPINLQSLAYLRAKDDAPDFVYQSHLVAGEELLTPVKIESIFWKPKIVEADELPISETYKLYADAMANLYGANKRQLRATIQCESGWTNSARGKAGEIGIAQYLPSTFRLFEKEFGRDLDIYNARHQLELTAWAFADGKENHWTCFRNVARTLK